MKLFVPPRAPIGNFPSQPTSLAVLDGAIWFDTRGHNIGRAAPDGTMTLFPTPDIVADHLAAGPDGNIWFTDNVGNPDGYRVGYLTPTGAMRYFVVSGVAPADFKGIVAGPDGAMWFAMYASDAGNGHTLLGRVSMDGVVTIRQLAQGPTSGLTRGLDGSLWVLNNTNVQRLRPDGTVTTLTLPEGLVAGGAPAIGPDGNIWMAAGMPGGSKHVLRLTPGGTFTEFDFPSGEPWAFAAGPDGALWVTSGTSHTIVRMSVQGAVLEVIRLGNVMTWDIIPGPDGRMWFAGFGPQQNFDSEAYLGRIDP